MKILFVYRGYGENQSNAVIDYQRASLCDDDRVEISSFVINEGGYRSYARNLRYLNKYLMSHSCDLIHAHYSFSGFVARMATGKPVVCSLMGSDLLHHSGKYIFLIKIFNRFFWNSTIVKSSAMQKFLQKSYVIPNGIDLNHFRPIQKQEAIKITGFDSDVKNIIFVALDPDSKVKNLALANIAISFMKEHKIKFHIICGEPITMLPYFYNAADLLLLSSISEGSPNVIKEAMACNCPIVATDVGDIREVIGETEGCYITSFDPADVADKIKLALEFGKRTNGREKIAHLDNRIIAGRIVDVYREVLGMY